MNAERQTPARASLHLAAHALAAARSSMKEPGSLNHYVSYLLQQAAEQLARAVRADRGLLSTNKHDFSHLIDGIGTKIAPLPDNDPWRDRLKVHEHLFRFATAYRYPSQTGTIPQGLDRTEAEEAVSLLEKHLALASQELR